MTTLIILFFVALYIIGIPSILLPLYSLGWRVLAVIGFLLSPLIVFYLIGAHLGPKPKLSSTPDVSKEEIDEFLKLMKAPQPFTSE